MWAANALAAEPVRLAVPPEQTTESGGLVAFDIPAQSLTSALDAYSAMAHRQVLYNAQLAIQRQSNNVKGYFTPEAALQFLLTGTGLMPRYMAADAFVLVADGAPRLQTNSAPADVVMRYYGLIQASLKRALCANKDTLPGDYRVAVGFRIGPSGAISRAELLGSTGDHLLDATIASTVGRLTIGAPPPPGFAQPVVMMVTPQSEASMRDCGINGTWSAGAAP